MGITDILSKIFGNKSQRDLKEITPYVNKITELFPTFSNLSNDELRAKTLQVQNQIAEYVSAERTEIIELKEKIKALPIEKREDAWSEVDKKEKEITAKYEEILEKVLPEVFCILKETARRLSENEELEVTATPMDIELARNDKNDFLEIRDDKAIYFNSWTAGGTEIVWNMVHYDVQLFGGVVLHKGKIAEMATGEGKTLVGTLPMFLNALTKQGVHVVTVNDYLSKRDSEWMGPLFQFHGLSVECIDKHEPNSDSRRRAYNADITYGTNNEFGFDYLRDNMAINPADLVQRKHNYAIVDEVDSVLIDDARTPLIIAGPVPKGEDQLYEEFKPRVETLFRAQKELCTSLLSEAKRKMVSTDKKVAEEGVKLLFRSFKGLPKNKALIKFLSEEGVRSAMLKVEEYYMSEQNKHMPEVTDDLFFVLDEKNNSVELSDKGIDRLSAHSEDPKFFILPDISTELSAVEGAANTTDEEKAAAKDEIMQNYSIKAERVHTVNQLLKAFALFEIDDQYVVIDNKVMIVDEQTGRIMDGRRYSDGLHQAIEAKENVKIEAATQTFATVTLQNYFRMYNKLSGMTGTAETEAGELWDIYKLDVVVIPTNRVIARNDMNDRIYKTKREKYTAVIEEIEDLVGQGRAVLVGTTSVEISELLSKMLQMRKIPHNVLNAKLHQREAEIVALAGQTGAVTIATNMAGRGTDIKLAPEVKAAGGLAIIGTERHESRRVDRQLRGRAGRQGDPGSSIFYISLEDSLMRLFASERISKMMDRMGFKEGEMLEHSMLNKSVERAQKKVEENNFGIRKRLLEYDDVLNYQRELIYKKRRHALIGERLGIDIVNMFNYTTAALIHEHIESKNYEDLKVDIVRLFAMECPLTEDEFRDGKANELIAKLFDSALDNFKKRMERMAEIAKPLIKHVYETQGDRFANIVIPITDGKRIYNINCNLKESVESECTNIAEAFEKSLMLHVIDEQWKEHLREMDDLRQSVQNASYEQKDPLLIYKLESKELFESMLDKINAKTIKVLMRGQIPMREGDDVQKAEEAKTDYSKMKAAKEDIDNPKRPAPRPQPQPEQKRVTAPITVDKEPGRNDLCYCGSGKKYKHCHGSNS